MNSSGSTEAPRRRTSLMCWFRAGDGLFAMDTTEIREVLRAQTPQHVPLAPDFVDGIVPYRGDVLTTLSFRVLLGMEKRHAASYVLVLDDDNEERFGLAVDSVCGVVDVGWEDIGPVPANLDARSAAFIDGVCTTPAGLMARLDPARLRPSRLAVSGLFTPCQRAGEQR